MNGNPTVLRPLREFRRTFFGAILALQLPLCAALYQCPPSGGMPGAVRNTPAPGCERLIAHDGSGLNMEPVYIVPDYSQPLPPPAALRPKLRTELQTLLDKEAQSAAVPPDLVYLVIQQESHFNSLAVSARGALGMMQLMPDTARQMGVANPWDPAQNMRGGIRYLGLLIRQFSGSLPLAVAAYNAGPKAVENAGQRVPRFLETRNYVQQIFRTFEEGRWLAHAQSLMSGGPPSGSGAGRTRPRSGRTPSTTERGVSLQSAPANAGDGAPGGTLYRWLDEAGQEHVTNYKPAQGKIIGVIGP